MHSDFSLVDGQDLQKHTLSASPSRRNPLEDSVWSDIVSASKSYQLNTICRCNLQWYQTAKPVHVHHNNLAPIVWFPDPSSVRRRESCVPYDDRMLSSELFVFSQSQSLCLFCWRLWNQTILRLGTFLECFHCVVASENGRKASNCNISIIK